jgi:hypothetical protein
MSTLDLETLAINCGVTLKQVSKLLLKLIPFPLLTHWGSENLELTLYLDEYKYNQIHISITWFGLFNPNDLPLYLINICNIINRISPATVVIYI